MYSMESSRYITHKNIVWKTTKKYIVDIISGELKVGAREQTMPLVFPKRNTTEGNHCMKV